MSQISDTVETALQYLRSGDFQHALQLSAKLRQQEPLSFWPVFINTVAAAFLGDYKSFEDNLELMRKADEYNPYLRYLFGFRHLASGDIEKALWEYSHLSQVEDKWLATDILEKIRKGQNMAEEAQTKGITAFVALPATVPVESITPPNLYIAEKKQYLAAPSADKRRIELAAEISDSETIPVVKKYSRKKLYEALAVASGIILFTITFVLLSPKFRKAEKPRWEDFSIRDQATVLPIRSSNKAKYTFTDRDELVNDFEMAKKKLHSGSINQARFLLQRITISNADFVSREKARIFTDFIPEQSYEEFKDNITITEIQKNPVSRLNSLIVTEGKILNRKNTQEGESLSIAVHENGNEYLAEIFSRAKAPETVAQGKNILVFGRYKGLITARKIVYIEAIRIIR